MKNKVTTEMLKRLNEELTSQQLAMPVQGSSETSRPQITDHGRVGILQSSITETPHEVSKIQSALDVLSPSMLRGNGRLYEPGNAEVTENYWLVVIWAIASLGWQCGKEMARRWSQQSDRYTDEGFERAWGDYDPEHPRPIGIGSLYKLAMDNGWQTTRPLGLQPVSANDARYKRLSAAEVIAIQPQKWSIKHTLPATGIAAIFGPSGSGKSFLAIDMAAVLATGRNWFGRRTRQAHVVYVMLEGEGGIRNRIAALEKVQGELPSEHFSVVIQPFHLTSAQDVTDLASVIPGGAVVIIDTLNRAAPTADENSSKDMGLILEGAKTLQGIIKGLVVVVHHTGKDTSKGMRGHSSLHAALDAAIEVERSAAGIRTWSVAKSKDGEDGKQVAFKLVRHVLGQDEDGEDITSCTVEPEQSHIFVKPEPSGIRQRLALKAVKAALAGSQASTGIAGCPDGTKCMKVEDAVIAVAAALKTTLPNKRRNEARRLITSLSDAGYFNTGYEGEDAWCWLE